MFSTLKTGEPNKTLRSRYISFRPQDAHNSYTPIGCCNLCSKRLTGAPPDKNPTAYGHLRGFRLSKLPFAAK